MKLEVVKNSFLALFTLLFVFGLSYWLPRSLSAHFGENSPWTSYLYTYGMGLVFFLLSVIWIFSRKGMYPLRRKQEIYWLAAVVGGLIFIFSLHGLWIFTAVQFPIKN